MKLAFGFDLETTGLEPTKDDIIEFGGVLWDLERSAPVMIQSDMVKINKPLPEEITKITGITSLDLDDFGVDRASAWEKFWGMWAAADCVVAHNGRGFDIPFLKNFEERYQVKKLVERPVIDTCTDVPYNTVTRKLTHLAAEHGFINPFAHRALFDVLTMFSVLTKYNFGEVLDLSKQPEVTMIAVTRPPWEDEGRSTTAAKGDGFRWDGQKKEWWKIVKEKQAKAVIANAVGYTIKIKTQP